jgi:hypothetical protein
MSKFTRHGALSWRAAAAGKVPNVELLGHGGRFNFTPDAAGLKVEMPAEKPRKHAVALKIEGSDRT